MKRSQNGKILIQTQTENTKKSAENFHFKHHNNKYLVEKYNFHPIYPQEAEADTAEHYISASAQAYFEFPDLKNTFYLQKDCLRGSFSAYNLEPFHKYKYKSQHTFSTYCLKWNRILFQF